MFKEKTYEISMDFELTWNTRIYSPHLNAEAEMGFDAALFSKNPYFWSLWRNPFYHPNIFITVFHQWKKGVNVTSSLWGEVQTYIDDLPPFKCNVFIQYKIPCYLVSHYGKAYQHWKAPYFRYHITPHQQKALSTIEKNLDQSAVVVYAAPSFWQKEQFFYFKDRRELTKNSNFARASELDNHSSYTYTGPGKNGCAYSEPTDVEHVDFENEVLRRSAFESPFSSNSDFITNLGDRLETAIEHMGTSFVKLYYGYLNRTLPESTFGKRLIQILSFVEITEVSWKIVIGSK